VFFGANDISGTEPVDDHRHLLLIGLDKTNALPD
jgi:hypothetical protein